MKKIHHAAAFVARFRAARQAAKLTQLEVAQRTGLSVCAISYLEQGRRLPSLKTAYALCEAVGDDAACLLLRDCCIVQVS